MDLVWDEEKDRANQEKHGVTFAEASELFASGVEYLEVFDEDHSDAEDRFIAIGPIAKGLVLVVWTEVQDDMIRIISARWATKREGDRYRSFMEGRADHD